MDRHITEVTSISSDGEFVTFLDNINFDKIRLPIPRQDLRRIVVLVYALLKPVSKRVNLYVTLQFCTHLTYLHKCLVEIGEIHCVCGLHVYIVWELDPQTASK